MKHKLIYKLQYTHYKLHNKVKNPDTFLSTLPTNLHQLNFWVEIMLLAKAQQFDIPMDAFIDLSDMTSVGDIISAVEAVAEKGTDVGSLGSVLFKVRLARHVFQIKVDQALERIMEETVMTAFAVNGSNHPSAHKLKQTAIQDYLKSQTTFLSQTTLSKITQYLSYNIQPQKQLKNISDIILGTFLVQQLAINSPSNNQQIMKYLTLCKKQSILTYLVEYIMRYDNMEVINLVVEIAEKMDRMGVIVKVFGANPEYFYKMFWFVVRQGREIDFKYFVNFMIEYSSVRAIVLHQILYPVSHIKQTQQTIQQLIIQQNPKLFTKFRTNPEQTSKKCIQTYLKLSNFHIPKQRIGQSYSDPLAVVGIVRKYWQHQFHGQVINYCLWVLLDGRFCKLTAAKCKSDQLGLYRRNLYLTLVHIALTYKVSTIVNYYPIEYYHLQQMFRLESLPSLLASIQNLSSILWLPMYANSELHLFIRAQNGYTLLLRLLQQKIGNYNHANILHQIEYDIMNIKHKSSKSSKVLRSQMRGVLRYFEDKKIGKEQVDKLVKALEYLDKECQ